MNSQNASAGPSRLPAPSGDGPPPPVALSDRLYVGNLSPTVDEYTLLQIFSKFGKVTKLDFMFHKTGVQKGKPRGYAFIEFSSKEDASKAMTKLHDRLLRGRKLVVTPANSAPLSDLPYPSKGRRHTEAPKTTTLSLLKSKRHPQSASAQIAAMEAKLAAMDRTKPKDEDYVPGSFAYPLAGGPGSVSGSASPAVRDDSPRRPIGSPDAYYVPSSPAGEATEEGNIGQAEAKQAAEVLEKEFQAQFDTGVDDAATTSGQVGEDTGTSTTIDGSEAVGSVAPAAPSTSTPSLSLPPKPVGSVPLPHIDPRRNAREDAFKKGLAGLPKRPAFAP